MDDETLTLHGSSRIASGPELQRWGPFDLVERVGAGGFGEVYRAFDPALRREVAVKLLLPGPGAEGEGQAAAILREARAMAKVVHPNLVPIYGVNSYNGRAAFWTAYVRGKTLSELVKRNGPFGAQETIHIGVDLCRALSAVHTAGLLHRDIKTGNAMREEGGRILLMDFGLTQEADSQTFRGGTPGYMAPEIAGGALATVRSDIYALGVLLYNLLTGKYPTPGDGSTWTLLEARPDLPAALVKTIHKAVHPVPAQRFASAGELAGALGDSDPAAKGKSRQHAGIGVALALVATLGFGGYRWFSSAPAAVTQRYEKADDLVEHYYRPKALETAIPELEKVVRLQPGYAAASADLGRANFLQFWQKKDHRFVEPAKKASEAAIALDQNLASPHVTLGMLYTQTGNNDLAAQELDTAMRIDRTNAEVWAARAELYYRQGRSEEVEPSIRKAIALAPSDWRWQKQLADYYDRTGHEDLAIAAAQSAVKITPDNARAYNNLGIYLRGAGRLKEAEEALRNAIAIEPSENRFTNLGGVERDLGNLDLAIQMFRKAISLSPDDFVAWENLAIVYRRQSDDVRMREAYLKAIELAEQQRVTKPKEPWLLADLGGMYAVLGDAEHAVPLLRQATALDPEDGDLLYRAGVSFEALHRREDAVPLIAAALSHGVPRTKAEHDPGIAAVLNDRRFSSPGTR